MIFIAAATEPTMLLMLTEQDCNDMRGGRTKFVDQSATKGHKFDKVVLSLHKNQSEIEAALRQSGHGKLLQGMPSPVAQPGQSECKGCKGLMSDTLLLEGRCIACWRQLAKLYSGHGQEPTKLPAYADLHDLSEDDRIETIGIMVLGGRRVVAVVTDADPGKLERYISKLATRFPGIRVLQQLPGPVPNTVTVRLGPPGTTAE